MRSLKASRTAITVIWPITTPMSVATKTHPTKLTFRPGTPSRVITDARRRYSRYLLEQDTETVNYFETDFAKKIAATMTPGLWLKHSREAHGWSQVLLGEKLGGVKPSRISDWENNQRPISKATAKKFSALFHLSAEHFL